MHAGLELGALVAVYITAAAVTDLRTRKIPNWLTVPAAIAGFLFHTFTPDGIGPWWSLAGFAVGFVVLLLPWILGGGGMGDIKMLAALGCWLGPVWVLAAFALGMVLAAISAMVLMAWGVVTRGVSAVQRDHLTSRAADETDDARRPTGKKKVKRVLPFAVPVCVSTWLVVLWMIVRTKILPS
jgi:prepilin peptidase CpaA